MSPAARLSVRVASCCGILWCAAYAGLAGAQGMTTAAVRGTVRSSDGGPVDGVHVSIAHAATGVTVRTTVTRGRFFASGLEPGGPYRILLRRLGYHPQEHTGVMLALGEPHEMNFVLQPLAVALDTVSAAAAAFPRANRHGGTATAVPESLLHRLPSPNRNLYDFVRLAPQVSTRTGFAAAGVIAGGVGFRLNNFLVNGVPQRSLGGHVPPEFTGGRSLPLEAVREYQVLLSPFDARYGDFAGALINAVTRSGTNQLQGSAFVFARSDRLGRGTSGPSYQQLQYGFWMGGPLRRDRVHFFAASELQRLTSPAPGPYLGQATGVAPVSAADLARLEEILRGHGLAAGSGGPVENRNGSESHLARLDVAVPRWNSRAVLWATRTRAENLGFTRQVPGTFPLTTHAAAQTSPWRSASFQLHTALPGQGGVHNELLIAYRTAENEWRPRVREPVVRVAVPGTTGGSVTVVTGTPQQAQDVFQGGWALTVREHLTLPAGGAHLVSLGLEAERFQVSRSGILNAYGTWDFSSLDSLRLGLPERFEVRRDFGSAGVPIRGAQYAAYAGDRWRIGRDVALTLGLRAEALFLEGRPPYNREVDSIFARRTDRMPPTRVHVSPRLGFTWDVNGRGRGQLRGGVGVFMGRPPMAWLHASLQSYGVGVGSLRCGPHRGDLGPPPRFASDHRAPPETCANGAGLAQAPRGDVDLLDAGLRMAQTLRATLAYDLRLSPDLLATLEALLTHGLADFLFVNLNLVGPQGVDRRGRVLYGSIGPSGTAAPALRSDFSEVIELRNTSRGRAYQLSARLEKRFSRGGAGTAHYTFSRVVDVQTPLRVNTPGTVNWSSRAVSGRHDDLRPGRSLNDVPHRVVLAGTQRVSRSRWPTEISFYYIGESGSPFTYLARGGVRGRGDLNADGSNTNDPIYVPRSASDPDEIRFSGRSDEPGADNSAEAQSERIRRQQAAFERFIDDTPCLRRQRGRIVERNSCREPWSHTTVASLRQPLPLQGPALEAQLDAYNLLNLLSRGWGHHRIAAPGILEHVGQTGTGPETSQPVFRFDPTAPRWTTLPAESTFQLQIALRYRF